MCELSDHCSFLCLTVACWPALSPGSFSPFTLCEGHLLREGRDRQDEVNQRERQSEQWGKGCSFFFFLRNGNWNKRQYLRTKREVVKREWASLRKKDELRKKQTERERERKKQRYERGLSGLALKLFVVSGLSFKHTSQFKWLTVAIIFMVLQWDCVKWRESRM